MNWLAPSKKYVSLQCHMQLTYLYNVPITVTGQIRKKNEVIRKLQADLHHIEKFSEELIRRTKTDADKQEAADMKNSEGKQAKLQTETNTHRTELQTLVEENREREQQMRLVRRAVVAKLPLCIDTRIHYVPHGLSRDKWSITYRQFTT